MPSPLLAPSPSQLLHTHPGSHRRLACCPLPPPLPPLLCATPLNPRRHTCSPRTLTLLRLGAAQINVSLANLLTFPWIKEHVGRKSLQLHGWYYDLEQAVMETWQLRYQITDYERI